MAHPEGPGVTYICSACGRLVVDANTEDIDPGTTLYCPEPECIAATVVDLFTPEERKDLYEAREHMHFLPRFALLVILTPQGYDPATVTRAQAKMRFWLADIS